MKTVLYVCVHNAGRSQMAEALTNKLAKDRGIPVRALSAGTHPTEQVNPVAKAVMAEIGISLDSHRPKLMTDEIAKSADKIITMGCGVDAESCPARFHISEDWGLDDLAGQPIETVRLIRNRIQAHVEALLAEIGH